MFFQRPQRPQRPRSPNSEEKKHQNLQAESPIDSSSITLNFEIIDDLIEKKQFEEALTKLSKLTTGVLKSNLEDKKSWIKGIEIKVSIVEKLINLALIPRPTAEPVAGPPSQELGKSIFSHIK